MSAVAQLDAKRQETARRYAGLRRIASIGEVVVSAAYLILLLTTGASLAFRETLTSHYGNAFLVNGAYALGFALTLGLVTLPLSVVGGWWLPRKYGMLTQTFGQWTVDALKGLGITLAIGLVVVEVLYVLLAVTPMWWLIAGVLYVGFVVLLANLAPVILVPIFFKLTLLPDSPTTERLESLARRLGVRVTGVYRMDLSTKTTAANAALMGLGNTRRIVFGDTLLDRFTVDEIEVVFAHELGHQANRDIARLIASKSIVTIVSLFVCSVLLRLWVGPLGFAGIADVANLPVIALIVGVIGAITGPFANAWSRRIERKADAFALGTTNKATAFISAMTRLANQNLADCDPAWWIETLFYDHPSIQSRIRFAQQFARREDAE